MIPPFTFTPTMRTFLLLALCVTGFWFGLNSSLDDMTQADCRNGVQRACQQIQRGSLQ